MENFHLLLKWLEEAQLSVSSVDANSLCFTHLQSKRFEAVAYAAAFAVHADDQLVIKLSAMVSPVVEERHEEVTAFLEQMNARACDRMEWWKSDDGDLNLLYVGSFSILARRSGTLPVFYHILDYMVDEVDACYLDLVQLTVHCASPANDSHALYRFMKETLLQPGAVLRLDRDDTTWSSDRFLGRLSGWLWAMVDERKTPEINWNEVFSHQLLLHEALRFAKPSEREIISRLQELIAEHCHWHNNADGELGKWEGMAVYYRGIAADNLCRELEIDLGT